MCLFIGFLAAFVAAWLGLDPTTLAQDQTAPAVGHARFADRFQDEPVRPKASEPIHFVASYEEARRLAKASGRRLLVYFTGPGCAWCRVLEARTLPDAEVAALSREFVCVTLHTDRDSALADRMHVDSIPRSIVLDADGTTVDVQIGYVPAAEYAAWLKAAHSKPSGRLPAAGIPTAPAPMGASEGADFDGLVRR